jgi:hypothetical protein
VYVGYIDVSLDFAREEKCTVICFLSVTFNWRASVGILTLYLVPASFRPLGGLYYCRFPIQGRLKIALHKDY